MFLVHSFVRIIYKKIFTKGPVPLERIAVAFTSDYEIIAFLGIRD